MCYKHTRLIIAGILVLIGLNFAKADDAQTQCLTVDGTPESCAVRAATKPASPAKTETPAPQTEDILYAVMRCTYIAPPLGPRTSCQIMSMAGGQLIYYTADACEAKAAQLRPSFNVTCMSKTVPTWHPVR